MKLRTWEKYVISVVLVGILIVSVTGATSAGNDPEIESLQRSIDEKGYNWTAKRTWVTELSDDEFQALLGARIPEELQKRIDRQP